MINFGQSFLLDLYVFLNFTVQDQRIFRDTQLYLIFLLQSFIDEIFYLLVENFPFQFYDGIDVVGGKVVFESGL